jgi:hypothetical protein
MDAPVALYNIDEAPSESVDLSGRFSDVHREFMEICEKHGNGAE